MHLLFMHKKDRNEIFIFSSRKTSSKSKNTLKMGCLRGLNESILRVFFDSEELFLEEKMKILFRSFLCIKSKYIAFISAIERPQRMSELLTAYMSPTVKKESLSEGNFKKK